MTLEELRRRSFVTILQTRGSRPERAEAAWSRIDSRVIAVTNEATLDSSKALVFQPANGAAAESEASRNLALAQSFPITQEIEKTQGFREVSRSTAKEVGQIGIARTHGTRRRGSWARILPKTSISRERIHRLVIRRVEDPGCVHRCIRVRHQQGEANILKQIGNVL
jgi:hypothetical protein